MKLGTLLYHPKYGVVKLSKQKYSPLKNRIVWYAKDEKGKERELSGEEMEMDDKENERYAMIQGRDGVDGYSPVKGKDYFTKEDIEEFKIKVTPKKGKDYFDGVKGDKPVKGVDYFTESEAKEFLRKVTPIKGIHYKEGSDGKDGEKGEKGDKPNHKWEGTKLAFEKPDGTWGKAVDLKGKDGQHGGGGGGSFNAQVGVSLGDHQPGFLADKLVAGANITLTKTGNLNEQITISSSGSSLPDQTGNNGKFLTTDGSVASWSSIPGGGDMLASVYDPTNVAGDAFDMDNMVEGTTNKILTDSERTILNNTSGTNTGDQDLSGLVPYTGATTDLNLGVHCLKSDCVQATTSGGMSIKANNGDVAALVGAGGSKGVTFYDGVIMDAQVADRIALLGATKNIISADTATYPSLAELAYVKGVTSGVQTQLNSKKVFHGIEASGTLSFDNSTHILSIASGTNTYWFQGVKYTTASAITCDLDSFVTLTTNTLYKFYFDDATGTLKASANGAFALKTQVPVATVFWNGSAGAVQRETHNHTRDLDWHINAHLTIGARYYNGLDLTAPTTANDASLQIESGVIYDEDIAVTTGVQTTMRGFYQASSGVYTFTDYSLPYIGTSGQPQYLGTDTYTLTNVGASDFVCMWVYASTDISRPIYVIPTQASTAYNIITGAEAEQPPVLTGLNVAQELKLIYKFIYKGDGQFQQAIDYRGSASLPGGGSASTSAGAVSFTPSGDIVATTVQTAIEELDSEKVAKATYDAHSILYATTDNTPVALTVGEQTLVGRATGGNISAISIDSDLSSVSANDDTVPSAKATKAMGDLKMPIAGGTFTGAVTTADHGTATNPEIVSVVYGTSATPPTANTTPIGTIYVQYVA